jgi:hypothetical protein
MCWIIRCLQIDTDAITRFVAEVDPSKLMSEPSIGYPLNFDGLVDEVNFMAVTQLLNIGSGFRQELHAVGGRGAWETILFGVMGLFLSGQALDADRMIALTITDVEQNFNLPLTVDQAVGDGPIKMSVPSPVRPLAEKIRHILNDTGRILRNFDFPSLGHFVLNIKANCKALPSEPTTVQELVFRLTSAFPAFRDVSIYGPDRLNVACYKKVQVMCSYLHYRYKAQDRSIKTNYFNYPDLASLTVFADNVVPCMFRHFGILQLDPALGERIDRGDPVTGL